MSSSLAFGGGVVLGCKQSMGSSLAPWMVTILKVSKGGPQYLLVSELVEGGPDGWLSVPYAKWLSLSWK